MSRIEGTRDKLKERVSNVLRRIEILEDSYETVTVGQLVAMRARTHGPKAAIEVFERGERATYSEMDLKSNQYARALRAFGAGKGDRIGVMLPNRIEFPILWFAIAKLGAVMVPINMRYTPREVEYVLSDTEARFAIVDQSAWSVFSAMDPWPGSLAREQVILIGQRSDVASPGLDQVLKGVGDLPLDEDVRPDDLLNVAYTSGTTGFPKGCMQTHDFWGTTSYQLAYWDVQPYERYLSAAPFFYGDAQVHLLRSYRQAATLYQAPQLSSTRFLGWLKKYRIEWCSFPELVSRQLEANDVTTDLKQIANFGWSSDSLQRFRERFRVPGQNGYGMTEVGYPILMPLEFVEMADSGSVGLRSPFGTLCIMNDDGAATPTGEIGELWVRGRSTFRGYWNKPEANAASFDGNWFKTGDLMRRDELGFHWLVGRKKDMIRRSSENIAAREVEAVIREITQIADVAAVPVKDLKRGEEVKIYVELKVGLTPADLPVERILEHARARLAVFKVPRYIAFIPCLPRTVSTNKVLKRELMNVSDPLAGSYDAEEKRWRRALAAD